MSKVVLKFQFRKDYSNFSLEVENTFYSGITSILGPSGSGKTTVLSCIAGLSTPNQGEIYLKEQLLFSSKQGVNLPPEKRRIGYVFQNSLLFPHMSVRQNMVYGYHLTPSEYRNVSPDHLINLLEISELLDRRPDTLSGGESQRVSLARALATSPELLLLDEPLASLDQRLRGKILRYLREIHRELKIPMVYVTHNISESLALSDMSLVLIKGKPHTFTHTRQLLDHPFYQSVSSPTGLENLLDVEIVENLPERGLTRCSLGESTLFIPKVDALPGTQISVAIRAGDIILAKEKPINLSARNVLKVKILEIYKQETQVIVYVTVGIPLVAEISQEALDKLKFQSGEEAYIIMKSSSITVLH